MHDRGHKQRYESLMGPNWNGSDHGSDLEGNQKLLGEHAHLSDQNRKLHNAIRVGNEAEVVAKDTKVQLHADGEKMERMRRNIGNINGELKVSDKLLNIIKKNESRNSLILYGVA